MDLRSSTGRAPDVIIEDVAGSTPAAGFKRCSICKLIKPSSEFHWKITGKCRQARCAECARKSTAKWVDQNRERHRVIMRDVARRKTYGIDAQQFATMVAMQGGVCAICGKPERQRQRDRVVALSIDHDHKTNKVRGLLCHNCNRKLGVLEDEQWRKQAEAYLAKFTGT